MTADAAEAAARLVEPGGDPPHEHPTITPAPNMAHEVTDEAVEILDRVRAAQRAVERPGDAEPLQGQRFLEPFAQGRGGAGMGLVETGGELFEPSLRQRGIGQPVSFAEGAADPRAQRLGQMLQDGPRLVDLAPLDEPEGAACLADRLPQSRPAVDDEERRPIEIEAAF